MRPTPSRSAIRLLATMVVVLIAVGSLPAFASAAQWPPPGTVWIEESGHTVDGYFLDEWRAFPDSLGLPITEEIEEPVELASFPADTRIIQYFEHLAIVYVPEAEERIDQVQALPLGEAAFKDDEDSIDRKVIDYRTSCGYLTADQCRFFPETRHSVRLAFLAYWNENDGSRLIGLPITEEFIDEDGVRTQYFTNAVLLQESDRSDVTPRQLGIDTVRTRQIESTRVPRPEGIPAWDESLFIPPPDVDLAPSDQSPTQDGEPGIVASTGGITESSIEASTNPETAASEAPAPEIADPGPQQGAYKEIVVSISAQTLWAYEGNGLVAQSLVSTGTGEVPETVTPLGYYTILVKYDAQTMQGTISDEYYRVEDVPWVMYFDNLGNAIHGTYWHDNFGVPMSHGCVNLPVSIAEMLYYWAPEGTAVTVIA